MRNKEGTGIVDSEKTQGDGSPENESHEEMLRYVRLGRASILSDDQEPGGRFQVAAIIMGDPSSRLSFVLTEWRQDAKGDWRSGSCLLLKQEAPATLLDLLRSAQH